MAEITKVSKRAFAMMVKCYHTKKTFGVTVDPTSEGFKMVWAFRMSERQGKKEKYDKRSTNAPKDRVHIARICPCPSSKVLWIRGGISYYIFSCKFPYLSRTFKYSRSLRCKCNAHTLKDIGKPFG